MSKIINNPKECACRHQVHTRLGIPMGFYTCKHPSMIAGTTCGNEGDTFPAICPLEDGLPKKSIHWS